MTDGERNALAFRVGQSVRIRYAADSVLSGRTGTITNEYMDGTFSVKVEGDIMGWHLSADELERLPALSAEAPLAVGMRVKVKHTGSLFYGVTGVIVSELDGEPHGWHVEFEGSGASYVDTDLERLPTPVSELEAARAECQQLERIIDGCQEENDALRGLLEAALTGVRWGKWRAVVENGALKVYTVGDE